MTAHRSPTEVFEDHLRMRLEGRLEDDLHRNFAEDVILLTANSSEQGHEAIRTSAGRLKDQLPDAEFEYVARQVNGEFALLVWRARSSRYRAVGGADTFVIRDGKICLQTIHYELVDAEAG